MRSSSHSCRNTFKRFLLSIHNKIFNTNTNTSGSIFRTSNLFWKLIACLGVVDSVFLLFIPLLECFAGKDFLFIHSSLSPRRRRKTIRSWLSFDDAHVVVFQSQQKSFTTHAAVSSTHTKKHVAWNAYFPLKNQKLTANLTVHSICSLLLILSLTWIETNCQRILYANFLIKKFLSESHCRIIVKHITHNIVTLKREHTKCVTFW